MPQLRRPISYLGALLILLGMSAVATPAVAAPTPVGIALQGVTTAIHDGGSTLQIARPDDTVEGDVLIARIANRGDAAAAISAVGWTEVGANRSARWIKSAVFVRVIQSEEPLTYTFTASGGTGLVASVSAYSGVDPQQPVERFAGRVSASSTVLRTPDVSAETAGTMAVWLGVQLSNGVACPASAIAPPVLFGRDGEGCLAGADSPGLTFTTASRSIEAAGPVTTGDGSSGSPLTNIAQVVTLRASKAVVVADSYAPASVDVAELWDGLTRSGARNTAIDPDLLHEPSGIATSRRNPGIGYVHSESDVPGMVAIRLRDGAVVGRYTVAIPHQWDWEDIAVGPCPTGTCIYAGDIGRANGKSNAPSTFAVYRVNEPDLAAGQTAGVLRGAWLRFQYPDGAKNAEALLVHPRTAEVFVVTKERSGASGVYAFPNPLPAPSATAVTTLEQVAQLSVPAWDGDQRDQHARTWARQVTAGAIHPAGDRFVLRTPYAVWEYRAPAGRGLRAAFAAAPVKLSAPSAEAQGESIDYAADGSAYYTVGERERRPYVLKRVDAR